MLILLGFNDGKTANHKHNNKAPIINIFLFEFASFEVWYLDIK